MPGPDAYRRGPRQAAEAKCLQEALNLFIGRQAAPGVAIPSELPDAEKSVRLMAVLLARTHHVHGCTRCTPRGLRGLFPLRASRLPAALQRGSRRGRSAAQAPSRSRWQPRRQRRLPDHARRGAAVSGHRPAADADADDLAMAHFLAQAYALGAVVCALLRLAEPAAMASQPAPDQDTPPAPDAGPAGERPPW